MEESNKRESPLPSPLSSSPHSTLLSGLVKSSESLSRPSSPSNLNSPKKTLVAKRIIDRLISESDTKSTAGNVTTSNNHHTSSTLSADLLTRLNFSNSSNPTSPHQQVVKFNTNSLNDSAPASKVIVSSTTDDNDILVSRGTGGKIISLKRKLNEDAAVSSDALQSSKSVEYVGVLKNETSPTKTRSLTMGERIKIVNNGSGSNTSAFKPISSGGLSISIETNKSGKVVKMASDAIDLPSSSVFNRIKKTVASNSNNSISNNNCNNKPSSVVLVAGTKSAEKPKVISLNKNSKQSIEAVVSGDTHSAKKIKSLRDRLSFN